MHAIKNSVITSFEWTKATSEDKMELMGQNNSSGFIPTLWIRQKTQISSTSLYLQLSMQHASS